MSKPFNQPNFPYSYYHPTYYYPIQQPYQPNQPNMNYQQPLYFEVPEDNSNPDYPNPVSPFIQYFQNDQGEVDLDKVITTANQFMKTASQFGPMIKSINDVVKSFRQ